MLKLYKNLKVVFTVDEPNVRWTGRIGVIDAGMIKDEIPDYLKTVFYLCGPPGMVEALRKLLGNVGIQGDQIKTENFQGY